MNPVHERQLLLARRHFFGRFGSGIGVAALATLQGNLCAAAKLSHL